MIFLIAPVALDNNVNVSFTRAPTKEEVLAVIEYFTVYLKDPVEATNEQA